MIRLTNLILVTQSQDKMYKSFEDSIILIKNQLYTIQQTINYIWLSFYFKALIALNPL